MPLIAGFIAQALRNRDDEAALGLVRKDVGELCARFPAYPAS